MKKLKYLLFLFIVFISPYAYALDYNVTNIITSPVAPSGVGTYTGEERNGATSSFNVNTRYNGLLQRIRYNIPKPSSIEGDCYMSNMTYKVTMNMATNDWRNRFGTVRVVPYSSSSTNFSNGKVTFVSYKKIYFTFKIPSSDTNCYDFVYIDLPSSATFTPFTGDINWNLQSVILSDELTSGGSTTPVGPSTSFNDTSIIDNNNKNTQDVINNNNENTTNIINNNNQNTQEIKDSIKDNLNNCRESHNLFNINGEVNINGSNNTIHTNANSVNNNILTSNTFNDYGYGQKFTNLNGKTVTFSAKLSSKGSGDGAIIVLYDNNNVVNISYLFNVGDTYSYTYTCTSDNIVFGFTSHNNVGSQLTDIQVNEGSSRLSYEPYGQICTNKIDSVNNSINNLNDSLTDETAPTIDLDLDIPTSASPVSDLLLMPITLLNKIYDITDDKCSSYTIPFDFFGGNKTLTFPCLDLKHYLGENVYNIVDNLLCFLMCYEIAMMCISIYESFTSLSDNFNSLYSPRHAKPLGKHTSEVE